MNYHIFQQINGWAGHSKLLDNIMIMLSDSLPYIAVAIILYLWFIGNKQLGIEKRYTAMYTIFSSAIALVINAIIHLVYYHPRPFVTHHVHQLVPHTVDSSFVSDHAVLVFAIAWTFIMRNERFKYPIFIWAIVVGISRIYVGVHYPFDVIGSALLSCATSGIVLYLSAKLEPLVQLMFRLYNQLIKLKQLLPKH